MWVSSSAGDAVRHLVLRNLRKMFIIVHCNRLQEMFILAFRKNVHPHTSYRIQVTKFIKNVRTNTHRTNTPSNKIRSSPRTIAKNVNVQIEYSVKYKRDNTIKIFKKTATPQ